MAQQEYNDLQERIEKPMEEIQGLAPPLAPPEGSNSVDVLVSLNEQKIDMDLNNPGIDKKEKDGVGPALKQKRLTHFDQMMTGLSHFENESLASFLSHFQTYSEQRNVIDHEDAVTFCG